MHNISVVIPVGKKSYRLKQCLEAVTLSNYQNYELILIDDGCEEGFREIGQAYKCRIINNVQPGGVSRARNTGAEASNGEVIFFLDSDVIIKPDSLFLIDRSFRDKEVDGVVGVQSEDMRFRNFSSQYKNLWMRYTYLNITDNLNLFYTSAAAIRKEVFLKTGGFDENYKNPGLEDTDLGQRLGDMGYKIILLRELEIEHVKHYNLSSLLKQDLLRAKELTRLFLRNKVKPFDGHKQTSVPGSFMISVICFGLSLSAVFGYALTKNVALASIGISLFICFYALNLSFINYLKTRRGYMFAARACFFMFVDMFPISMGIALGLLGYIFGRKY